MAQFTVNAQRLDPYKNFKFLVYWVGSTQPVAGISKISPRSPIPVPLRWVCENPMMVESE